ncbi:hypothetical protein M3610_09205 [Neobacillus sp. MER 74]|uniref:hypothetical protein n=1 Tax=Neobacillus sp. MER 74 TaxID=2939566 RepID=UPI00203E0AA2|nr:hypothetical protein [Neobacillus sp. MER 74]MCM3115464.1 hypothetical protein [Neobacillus sp. MER 74]
MEGISKRKINGQNNPCYGRTGDKHPLFKGYFYMIDLDTNKKWRFSSTYECSRFAKEVLNLTLSNSSVYYKLSDKYESSIYQDRYQFIWEEQSK